MDRILEIIINTISMLLYIYINLSSACAFHKRVSCLDILSLILHYFRLLNVAVRCVYEVYLSIIVSCSLFFFRMPSVAMSFSFQLDHFFIIYILLLYCLL